MFYRVSQLLLELIIRICARVEITGRENIPPAGPYIIISNHSSNIDPPLLGMTFRRQRICFLAKKELFGSPLMGTWVKGMNMVAIDRKIGVSGIKGALARLEKGSILGIFPEGRRVTEGEKTGAKKGLGFIVAKSGVSVIPVYIDGSGKVLPKGGKIAFGEKIKVEIGKVISSKDPFLRDAIKNKNYEGITNYLMGKVTP
jgi:1-acyl-sn-glycerol-3-phosphate acyltransferase